MTKENKELIKEVLKLLFFPITGFYFMCKECKELQSDDFMTEWFQYMLGVILWSGLMLGIAFVTWGLIYQFDKMIVPISLIGGGIFFFFILPITLHKLIHKK